MTASAKRMKKCHTGKQRFDDRESAQVALQKTLQHSTKKGNPIATMLRVYGCACGGFHFGKTREINWDLIK